MTQWLRFLYQLNFPNNFRQDRAVRRANANQPPESQVPKDLHPSRVTTSNISINFKLFKFDRLKPLDTHTFQVENLSVPSPFKFKTFSYQGGLINTFPYQHVLNLYQSRVATADFPLEARRVRISNVRLLNLYQSRGRLQECSCGL